MPIYVAEYKGASGGIYGSYIKAKSLADARLKAKQRGMRERVIGQSMTGRHGNNEACSRVLRSPRSKPMDCIHALTFLALFALASRAATARDFFDDDAGLIHQWVHLEKAKERPDEWRGSLPRGLKAQLLARVDEIEQRIPGYVRW